jgi:predicted nucleic acid-binding protein
MSFVASEYVVDASALIEALTAKTDNGRAVQQKLRNAQCHAPHLIDAQLGSTLRKQVRRGDLSEPQGHGLLRAGTAAIHEHYPHWPLADAAWKLRDNLSYYDALYAALASRLDIPLLTADKRLANAPGLPCAVELGD